MSGFIDFVLAALVVYGGVHLALGVLGWITSWFKFESETGQPCPCCKARHDHACCCGCFPKCARTCDECGGCPEHCACGLPVGAVFDSKMEIEGAA